MITQEQRKTSQKSAAVMIQATGIQITADEANRIEVVDFGLNNLVKEGVQVLALVKTQHITKIVDE